MHHRISKSARSGCHPHDELRLIVCLLFEDGTVFVGQSLVRTLQTYLKRTGTLFRSVGSFQRYDLHAFTIGDAPPNDMVFLWAYHLSRHGVRLRTLRDPEAIVDPLAPLALQKREWSSYSARTRKVLFPAVLKQALALRGEWRGTRIVAYCCILSQGAFVLGSTPLLDEESFRLDDWLPGVGTHHLWSHVYEAEVNSQAAYQEAEAALGLWRETLENMGGRETWYREHMFYTGFPETGELHLPDTELLLSLPPSLLAGISFCLEHWPMGLKDTRLPLDNQSAPLVFPGFLKCENENPSDWESVARSQQDTLEIIQTYVEDMGAMFEGTLARQKALHDQMKVLSRTVLEATALMVKLHAASRPDDI